MKWGIGLLFALSMVFIADISYAAGDKPKGNQQNQAERKQALIQQAQKAEENRSQQPAIKKLSVDEADSAVKAAKVSQDVAAINEPAVKLAQQPVKLAQTPPAIQTVPASQIQQTKQVQQVQTVQSVKAAQEAQKSLNA